jgi:flavodoxin
MNAFIVYYSLSGTTRAVATALAQEIAADIEEIRGSRYAAGVCAQWQHLACWR